MLSGKGNKLDGKGPHTRASVAPTKGKFVHTNMCFVDANAQGRPVPWLLFSTFAVPCLKGSLRLFGHLARMYMLSSKHH